MTLNSIRRWCLISQKDARWEVFLTILYVWCTVCGGASSSTTVEQTLVVQTDSEVCIVKTRSPITTAMRPKQNKTCTPVTFTLTLPTTTIDSTSTGSSRTNEASTEYPTTTLIFPEPTTAPSATENTAPLFTTTTRPATETTFVTPTTMPMFSEITTFLTTTSLKNATQLSATNNPAPTELATQSSMSLATTDTSAPTLIIVTQETTMSLSMSTTSDSQTTDETPLVGTGTETIQTTAVITSTLLFNSSSPVPSEALVLNAISKLRESRESQLNGSVKVVNVTYQKTSETSYVVIFSFNLSNISMPENPKLINSTYVQLQDVVNNALNTLLNEPTSPTLKANSTSFESTSNLINGRMEYTFQDGDIIQPVSFLNELRTPTELTSTTVFPQSTTGSSVTLPNLISGSAVITSTLLFNSSSPVPSEALVLNAINKLLLSRESQLNNSVKVVNVTYQKMSETSYVVIFGFNLSNISMPENPELRNSTYVQLQDVVNNALNTLLNEPTSPTLKANSTNFESTSNQINGSMEYTFQDGDIIQPVSFLNELRTPTELSTTTVFPQSTTSVTPASLTSGSAVITSTLLFNSSPVPSEALVLNAISKLRESRESQLNGSVKVVNVTYQKISETSYAVVFSFNLSNISMPENPELRNSTYVQLQDVVNNALNTLLNEPTSPTLKAKSTSFESTSNQINGRMEYTFQDDDIIQPVSFLNELRTPTVSTTASTLAASATSPPTVLGKVVIYIRLVFVTLGTLPNENDVIQVVNTLLYSRLATKLDTRTDPLSDPVSFVNVTYTKINETAYALNFGFEISNVTMSEKPEFRNGTYLSVQNSINSLLNKILTNESAPVVNFQPSDFTQFLGNSSTIQANVTYVFSSSDLSNPSIFIQELLQVNKVTPKPINNVVIKIRLLFVTLGPVPSESKVLEVVKSLLASNLTTKQATRILITSDPELITDITYSSINETAYALDFQFQIAELSVNGTQKVDAYQEIQNKINNLVSQILQNPSATLSFIPANFTDSADLSTIVANVTYIFSERDSSGSAAFGILVKLLFSAFTTPAPTTPAPTIISTTAANNSTNVAWIVAIIVPVAVVLILIPCWILLCCLLCGCCAAVRRRWHRRQSYNVQYTTRNSLF